jgi:methionyl-tRNA formyltransferase
MSLISIGTPDFAVPSLRRLHGDGHEIAAAVTQPDRPAGRGRQPASSPVKEAAIELGIPVLQPPSLRAPEVVEGLRALKPEVMVAVAYGQILRPEVLEIASRGVVNVHPSLLPRWRGASPIAGAILAGDKETGVTIMLMDAGMDSGPILAQRRHPISPEDTTGTLTAVLADAGADLLAETLPRWLAGEIEPVPQDDAGATVTRLVKKEDGAIDWTLAAEEIWRRVRAYDPWPGAYTSLDGENIRIWRARPLNADYGEPPGTIVEAPLGVQTGEGVLAVLEGQRPGRRRMSSDELVRGMPSLFGRRFETAAE